MDEQEREVVEWMRREIVSGETRLFEHIASTFRWLMATLFAANGGAIIALLGSDARDLPGRIYGLLWFALGAVCSLLMGVFSAYFGLRGFLSLNGMRMKLDESVIVGSSPEGEIREFLQKTNGKWITWIPSFVGGAALAFFVIGLSTIAGSIIRSAFP